MIEGDDVLAAQDEGVLHGVIELPYIAGPRILERSFQDIRGYRLPGRSVFPAQGTLCIEMRHVTGKKCNTSVACNTPAIQVRTL